MPEGEGLYEVSTYYYLPVKVSGENSNIYSLNTRGRQQLTG